MSVRRISIIFCSRAAMMRGREVLSGKVKPSISQSIVDLLKHIWLMNQHDLELSSRYSMRNRARTRLEVVSKVRSMCDLWIIDNDQLRIWFYRQGVVRTFIFNARVSIASRGNDSAAAASVGVVCMWSRWRYFQIRRRLYYYDFFDKFTSFASMSRFIAKL